MPIVGSPSPGINEGPDEDFGGFDLGTLGGGGRPDIGGGPLFNVPDFSVGIFSGPLFVPRLVLPTIRIPPISPPQAQIVVGPGGPHVFQGPVWTPPPPPPPTPTIMERPPTPEIFYEPPPPVIPDEATYPTPVPPPPPPNLVSPGIVQNEPGVFVGPIQLVPEEEDVSHDLGHILATIAGDYIGQELGIGQPPGFVDPATVTPTAGVPATIPGVPAVVTGGGGACYPPANTKGMIYSPRAKCGAGGWIKQRRRRKRLASASDIKDISALNSVLPKGMLKIWIATHA